MPEPLVELIPEDLDEEYTPEQLEEAEAEVEADIQEILDRHYGTIREEG